MRAIVLDFDGVICDSARECYVVALAAFASMVPECSLAPVLLAGRGSSTEVVSFEGDRAFVELLRLMPYGNRAEDFGVALAAIDGDVPVHDQRAYDSFFASFGKAWTDEFHRAFYQVRGELRHEKPDLWRCLHRPYQPVVTALRRHAGELPMAIATAKDGASARLLLEDFGIGDLFPDELLLDKETGVDKTMHLQKVASLLDLPASTLTFIDDKVRHLEAVAPLGVRCVLASWGYNGEEEVGLAARQGYLVCTLDGIEEVLFGCAPGGHCGAVVRGR